MDSELPTGRREMQASEFAALLKKNVQDMTPEEIADLLNFLTLENQKHWKCVTGDLGYVVNVMGGDDSPETSFTFRLVDSRSEPALAIHQYAGLNAEASRSRSRKMLEPSEKNSEAFGAFGRLLATIESIPPPGRPT